MKKIQTSIESRFRICDSMTDASGNKIPIIYGPLSSEEEISKKGYRYRSGFWNKILSQPYIQEQINSRQMLGMIEHPEADDEYMATPYDKAALVVMKVDVEDGTPMGTLALPNNPQGNALKALAELGVPIGISTRAFGDVLHDEVSDFIDDDSFALITWDATRKPNLTSAYTAKLTDSILSNPLYQGLLDAYQIRDSHQSDNYDKIADAESKKMLLEIKSQLNSIINKLNSF